MDLRCFAQWVCGCANCVSEMKNKTKQSKLCLSNREKLYLSLITFSSKRSLNYETQWIVWIVCTTQVPVQQKKFFVCVCVCLSIHRYTLMSLLSSGHTLVLLDTEGL